MYNNLNQVLTNLTKVSHCFTQTFQANARIVYQLGQKYFLSNPFKFINHPAV
jgi:hypothetical protein